MRIRLIALDLDGTALDSRGQVRPAVARSIAAARRAGVRVVACTGRRLRTAAPVLRELGVDGPAVVQNGALVKDTASGETLVCRRLPADAYARAHGLFTRVGAPLVYADGVEADFYYEAVERVHTFQAEYLDDHGKSGREVPSLETPPPGDLVMMSLMADREALAPVEDQIRALLGARVRTHLLENKNYRGYILEVVSADAGKWAGLLDVCRRESIDPADVMAIGDDHNDTELIERVGFGVAMGNAPEAVRRVARHVTGTSDEDGAAEAIERFVLAGPGSSS